MTITAIFEDGVLKPDVPLQVPEHARVLVKLELLDQDTQKKVNQETLAALESIWRTCKIRSPEEHLTRDQLHERR